MSLSFEHEVARRALVEAVETFVGAVSGASERDLLGPSRCHGWARLDVIAHVLAGWQELLGGLVCMTDAAPTVDAASYWAGYGESTAGADPVLVVLADRRRSAVWSRPSAALHQLRDVAAQVRAGATCVAEGRHAFQGQVLSSGDLMATWAVEVTVHHLDLDLGHASPLGLQLTRQTVEALVGTRFPPGWDDERVALVGAGRAPTPDDLRDLVRRLPVLG
jgi:hypothetical protein